MTYVEEWRSLSARIRAFTRAANLYARFQQSNNADTYGGAKFLGDQSQKILATIATFTASHKAVLPSEAVKSLEGFLEGHQGKVIAGHESSREIRAGAIFLAGIESEISFLLADRQEILRARSERAFLHLQRSLIVDESLKDRWLAAFKSGEVACERLGSVHLLAHGIYAFKIDAKGARTDLIFDEPPEPFLERRGLQGMVLTEWKVVEDKNALARFEEARTQAELYAGGALAGSELKAYRYLVAVSLKSLPRAAIPADSAAGAVTYRHVNIAIDPDVPSKQARR